MKTENMNLAQQRSFNLSRRHFLRGLGACMALPAFESLGGFKALAAATKNGSQLATSSTGAPLRMAVVYFPNGAIQDHWWPEDEASKFELNRTMKPLENVKGQVQVLGGLDHVNATPGPDGAGDHARASGSFLTGVRVRKTAGADIHAGISIDQVMANQMGHLTRFPSLELTCDSVRKSGNCDSGYSCAYQYNLAWRSPIVPVPPEPNPRLLFERLFGAGSPGERWRNDAAALTPSPACEIPAQRCRRQASATSQSSAACRTARRLCRGRSNRRTASCASPRTNRTPSARESAR